MCYFMFGFIFRIMCSRFIYVVTYISISFPYGCMIFCCMVILHLFIHSAVDGHLDYFNLLILRGAVINIHISVEVLRFLFWNIPERTCWFIWQPDIYLENCQLVHTKIISIFANEHKEASVSPQTWQHCYCTSFGIWSSLFVAMNQYSLCLRT